ncbi:glycosyltransferase [Niabella aurantiaca]|uniref:glycosyltransferase n=1 Tax=Niabella aurantiaca TaxID=379900 RepID=UPI000365777B|nr:glycosyltransferase [Niabella aurantiaca]
MIKIASLVPYRIVPPVTGGEKAVYYFLEGLSTRIPIDCFTVTENTDMKVPDVMVLPLLGAMRSKIRYINPLLFFRIRRACRANGIRHLVIEHPYYGWLGILLKYMAGLKLIVHSHNIESLRFRSLKKWWWPVLYAYERCTHKSADLNLFITTNDRLFGQERFGLVPEKTMVCTYGIPGLRPVAGEEKLRAKEQLTLKYHLHPDTRILLFNGTLSYPPNRDAVSEIVQHINPLLQKEADLHYIILICGSGLPAAWEGLKAYREMNVIYTGFVEDIGLYFDAADIFINPVTDGGGIKTKLVEALAAGARAVSYRSGAIGVDEALTGGNLCIVKDGDAPAFAAEIIGCVHRPPEELPKAFFDHFDWGMITGRVADAIEKL